MRSDLQESHDLPNLCLAEMNAPGRHGRALRAVGLDGLACLNSPVEISRVGLLVMRVGEIWRWRYKESSAVRSPFARLAVAGRAFVPEQVLTGH